MRIFMLCLLAVGALAVGKGRKGSRNGQWTYPGLTSPGKLTKRSSLTVVDDFNANIDDQFGQLVRYTQPGYGGASASGLVSAYTSDLTARQTDSLPLENQQQLRPSVTDDSQAGRVFLRQLGQRSDQPANLQEQQVAQGFQGYAGGSSVGGRATEAGLISELANAALPNRVPVALTVQAPRFPVKVGPGVEYPGANPEFAHVTNVHRVNVGGTAHQLSEVVRPASLPVPLVVREPLNYAISYEESFGPDQNVVIDESELQGFDEQAVAFRVTQAGSFKVGNSAGSSTDHQRADVADRHQDVSGLQQALPIAEEVVAHEKPEEELAVAISRVSDTQHSGYRYDAPARTFTF